MNSIFVACQHGGEKTPLEVIKDNFEGKINYLIANEDALKIHKRFIDSDLNRSFPGNINGNKEEIIAYDLLQKLKKFNTVFDLHTTTTNSPIFIITTSLSEKHLELINSLNISKVVYMQKSLASGKSLIDHVGLGVSIEAGKEGSKKTYLEYKEFIENYLINKYTLKKEYYVVYGIIKKEKNEKIDRNLESFKFIKKGQVISRVGEVERHAEFGFYPIMPGEKSYKGVLTLAAKRISLEKLKQNL